VSLRSLFDNHLGDLARALQQRAPQLTISRVGESGTPARDATDPDILRWCDSHGFVLVTRDISTMPEHVAAVAADGVLVPGVIIANRAMSLGEALELLELVAEVIEPGELSGTVRFLSSFL
jgi:hypothetical protein